MREEYKGMIIEVEQDDDPWDPREWDNNLGIMACFHGRYNLGDHGHGIDSTDYAGWDEMEAGIFRKYDVAVILPLYLYDHGNIHIKVGDWYSEPLPQGHARFDSGQVGFIFATKKAARGAFGCHRISKRLLHQTENYLRSEVDTYNKYISGEVYCYTITDPDGDYIVGSCSSFFSPGEAREEAVAMVNGLK